MNVTMNDLVALLSLSAMEVVLGIDNIVFISILADKLPKAKQALVRQAGIAIALIARLGLLFSISWVMGLTKPLFAVFHFSFTGRSLILLLGGLFLIAKATLEIHDKLEGPKDAFEGRAKKIKGLWVAFIQIVLLDLVFSLDSVITAVGMAQKTWIMVVAMVVAVVVMLVFSGKIGFFVQKHPTIKILALSFLLLIGVMLVVEGMGLHVSKGYIYFAMSFSLFVEFLNMRYRKATRPVELR